MQAKMREGSRERVGSRGAVAMRVPHSHGREVRTARKGAEARTKAGAFMVGSGEWDAEVRRGWGELGCGRGAVETRFVSPDRWLGRAPACEKRTLISVPWLL